MCIRDRMHFELKTCLGNEVQKLADLLHTSSNPDRLSSIVTQVSMYYLLSVPRVQKQNFFVEILCIESTAQKKTVNS